MLICPIVHGPTANLPGRRHRAHPAPLHGSPVYKSDRCHCPQEWAARNLSSSELVGHRSIKQPSQHTGKRGDSQLPGIEGAIAPAASSTAIPVSHPPSMGRRKRWNPSARRPATRRDSTLAITISQGIGSHTVPCSGKFKIASPWGVGHNCARQQGKQPDSAQGRTNASHLSSVPNPSRSSLHGKYADVPETVDEAASRLGITGSEAHMDELYRQVQGSWPELGPWQPSMSATSSPIWPSTLPADSLADPLSVFRATAAFRGGYPVERTGNLLRQRGPTGPDDQVRRNFSRRGRRGPSLANSRHRTGPQLVHHGPARGS